MKTKILVALLIVSLLTMAVPFVAYADPGNSEPGLERYLEISSNPNPDAQCGTGAGSGSFGYFGVGFNLGNLVSGHYKGGGPGANGYQTGLNNSGVCGNR